MTRPQLVPPLHVRLLIFGRKNTAYQVIDIIVERIRGFFDAVATAREVLLASIAVTASLCIGCLLVLFRASLALHRICLLYVSLVIRLLEHVILFIVCVRFNRVCLDFDRLLKIVRLMGVLLFEGLGHGLKVQRLHLTYNARIVAREMRRLMDARQAIWATHITWPIVDLKVIFLVVLTTVLTAGLPVTATRASQVLLLLLQLITFMGWLDVLLSARWGAVG